MTEPYSGSDVTVLREPFLDAFAAKVAGYTGAERQRVRSGLERTDPAWAGAILMLRNLDGFLQPSGDRFRNEQVLFGLRQRLRTTEEHVAAVLAADFDRLAPGSAPERRPPRLMDDLTARAAADAAFGRAVAVVHPVLLEAGEPVAVRAELLHRLEAIPEPPGLPAGRSVRGPQLRAELGRVSRHASTHSRHPEWPPQTFANGDMISISHALEIDAAGPGWTALPAWQARSVDPSEVLREGIRSQWASAAAPGVVRDLGLAEFVPGIETAPPPPRSSIETAADRLATRIGELTETDRAEVLNTLNSAGPGELHQWTQAARLLGPGLSEPAQQAVATTMREAFQQGVSELPENDRIDDWGRIGARPADRGFEHARMLSEAGRGVGPAVSADAGRVPGAGRQADDPGTAVQDPDMHGSNPRRPDHRRPDPSRRQL